MPTKPPSSQFTKLSMSCLNLISGLCNGHEKNKIMVMLGGVHTEMAGESTIGIWINGSKWIDNLVEADV